MPTLVDKWVSLHPSFGLVCWADDDELKQKFLNFSEVEFLDLGVLSLDDKKMLHGKVADLLNNLGIPALSKVVYREAILHGTGNNRRKATLIKWLLPYMQRYIYKMHRKTCINFQQNDIVKLSNLEVAVEKLSYKYMLNGCKSSSATTECLVFCREIYYMLHKMLIHIHFSWNFLDCSLMDL